MFEVVEVARTLAPERREGGQGRPQRLGDLIQRELAELIRLELRDPRVGMVTLTSVDVSPDMSHAKVFFTLLEKDKLEDTLHGLKRAAGFLRSQLAQPHEHVHHARSCASSTTSRSSAATACRA